jgi:translation initiation factor 4B
MTPTVEAEAPSFKRRGSGFKENGPVGLADTEETWSIGSRFKPSAPSEPPSRFGSARGRGDMGPPRDVTSPVDEGPWRRPNPSSRNSTSRKYLGIWPSLNIV